MRAVRVRRGVVPVSVMAGSWCSVGVGPTVTAASARGADPTAASPTPAVCGRAHGGSGVTHRWARLVGGDGGGGPRPACTTVRGVSALEWAEFAAALVTAFGLPIALLSYVGRKRRELRAQEADAVAAAERHDELAFDRLHAEYIAYLELQMAYPELDLGEEPLVDPPVLDDRQRVQEAAMFNIFISLIEHAHRRYALTTDRAKVMEWQGWEMYLDELLGRPNVERLWIRHRGQYDAGFVDRVERRRSARTEARRVALNVDQVPADDPVAIDFLVEAGRDPAAYVNTYLPRRPDRTSAAAWLDGVGGNRFLVRLGREPVGLLVAHEPRSAGVPDGYLETNTYVSPVHRGLGLATAAWDLVEPLLQPLPRGLAGVVWERNQSAAKRLERSGYYQAGRVFFDSREPGEESGWCRVWLKELEPARRSDEGAG
jgi:hypothetical protein